MAVLTVRNLSDDVHRALKVRASRHGRSTEAEVRAIIESVVKPPERVKMGSLLLTLGRKAGLTDADAAVLAKSIDAARDIGPHEPIRFE